MPRSSSVDFLTGPVPEAGKAREISPGVLWFRMPLPLVLDHVNLYALEDGAGWAIIDTGLADQTTRELWLALWEGPMAGRPVTRVICTHHHPDHMGGAGWICERLGLPVTASRPEWETAHEVRHRPLDREAKVDYLRRAGYTPEMQDRARRRTNIFTALVSPPPERLEAIDDGEVLTIGGCRWQVMLCGGHSPAHACLWNADDRLLIGGDQALPSISPIIGVWPPGWDKDPLTAFYQSLARLALLGAETLVLPSHGEPFRNLPGRCAELMAHHQARLDRVTAATEQPATILEAQQALFRRSFDDMNNEMATAETLAHLNYLLGTGSVAREADATGVWRYRRR